MSKDFDNRMLAVSQKIYERLLMAYPKAHRAEFGAAMTQLFRDQCRDAWNESQNRGVMKLWLHVLPDLVKTSFIERLAALNKRKSMSDKMTTLIQPRTIFLKVFAVVFLIILCTTVTVTFLLPETYASVSRIKAEPDNPKNDANFSDPYFLQTTFEIIQSQTVLDPVIDKLNLNIVWGKKYNGGEPLETTKTLEMLKKKITLSNEGNSKLIDIAVYSEDKNEAAQIANAIVQSYQDYRTASRIKFPPEKLDARIPIFPTVEIVESAKPGLDPVRPNKALNIVSGTIFGIILALVVGGIAALVIKMRIRKIPTTT
jgi:capsular polysaccharide biosynthesis protein